MLQALILICSISIPHADCRPETATQILRAPKLAENAVMCGFGAQAFVGGLSIAPGDGEYLLIRCLHRKAAS